jgi:hypothetical protein
MMSEEGPDAKARTDEASKPSGTPDRQVFLSMIRSGPGAGDGGPDVAVIGLDQQAILDILNGAARVPGVADETGPAVATTEVAWTRIPDGYRGLPFEAAVIVRDCAAQWRRAVWMDEAVLEGLGGDALPTRASRCVRREAGFVWKADHPEFGSMRADPVTQVDLFRGMLFVGSEFHVRAACETLARWRPDVLANALLADVGPRFGVAGRRTTRRSIVDLVGHDELRPMLYHEDQRVRRAAIEALGEDAPTPGRREPPTGSSKGQR